MPDAATLVVIVARDENASDNETDNDDANVDDDDDGARVSRRLLQHRSLHTASRAAVVREQVCGCDLNVIVSDNDCT